jgi:hypothetical protein
MSEFQYYEFQAIDRPLTAAEQDELRDLSSRAEITSRSFTNEYSYGDFRGDAEQVLADYFDAFLYMANWGTNRLMLRLPRQAVDPAMFEPYFEGEQHKMEVEDRFVILDFTSDDEDGGDWIEPAGKLDELLPLREQLLAGDLRCLYIAWLGTIPGYAADDENEQSRLEPPVPPGLGSLDAALKAWVDFMRVNEDLLAGAAGGSAPLASTGTDQRALALWVAGQSTTQKNQWLLELLGEDGATARLLILRQFRREQQPPAGKPAKRRSVGQLLQLVAQEEEKRKQREAAARAAEQKRKAQQRARYLDGLVGREKGLWLEAETQIAMKSRSGYERAVEILKDLHDLAEKLGQMTAFQSQLFELTQRHTGKRVFLERLHKAGLG